MHVVLVLVVSRKSLSDQSRKIGLGNSARILLRFNLFRWWRSGAHRILKLLQQTGKSGRAVVFAQTRVIKTRQFTQQIHWAGLTPVHTSVHTPASVFTRHTRYIIHSTDFMNISPVIPQSLPLFEPGQTNITLKRPFIRVYSLMVPQISVPLAGIPTNIASVSLFPVVAYHLADCGVRRNVAGPV